jgi:hypothetical protein
VPLLALLWWVAQGEAPTTLPASIPGWVWAALSALGGIAGTVLSGKVVVPTFAYSRELQRADRLETELAASRARELAMAEKMGTEVTTTILEATQAMRDMRDGGRDLPARRPRER